MATLDKLGVEALSGLRLLGPEEVVVTIVGLELAAGPARSGDEGRLTGRVLLGEVLGGECGVLSRGDRGSDLLEREPGKEEREMELGGAWRKGRQGGEEVGSGSGVAR